MAKKSKAKIKTGRPKTTGSGTPLMVRMHDAQIKALDRWIGDMDLSRPEAIRQIVAWGLSEAAKSKRTA